MTNDAHHSSRRRRSWLRLVDSISERPYLCLGMVFYWLWINMGFQTTIVFRPVGFSNGLVFPSQIGPLIASVIFYLLISFWFKRSRKVFRQSNFLWFICATMALASGLIVLWLDFTMVSADASLGVVTSTNVPIELSVILYVGGSSLFGLSSALLCIEIQRIFGSLGSQHILFHGSVAMLSSVLIIFGLSFLPQVIQQFVFVASPLPIAYCLIRSRKSISKKQLFERGLTAKLQIPYKLLVTSVLHGLSLGVLLGRPLLHNGETLILACNVFSYALAAILLLITAFSVKLNFNNLIYQIGFPLVAAGLYLSIVFNDVELVGIFFQFLGFCYLHLVMWGVCAYLIKHLNMPATWVIGISTGLYMAGQLLGALMSSLVSQLSDSLFWFEKMNVTVLVIMLAASLFMMSNRNLRTGWGLAKPDESEDGVGKGNEFAIQEIAADSALTKREVSILKHLSTGKNRKTISKELCISEETVKSHIRNIYKKVDIHSQQELLKLLEEKNSQDR